MISKNRKILYFYFILHRILQKTILLYIMILNLFSTINDLIYIYIFFFLLTDDSGASRFEGKVTSRFQTRIFKIARTNPARNLVDRREHARNKSASKASLLEDAARHRHFVRPH